MSLNLAELQQKVDRLLHNVTDQLKNHFELFYSPTPADINLEQYDQEGNLESLTVPNYTKMQKQSSPAGCIIIYSGIEIPQNWLLCDEQEVSINDYPVLFSIAKKGTEEIQPPFSSGADDQHFKLPNIQTGIDGTVYIIKAKP